ncbi:MAG: hypothetical protein OXT68_17770 [Chloroflexota bacterium]|nr:hypothetical protein [Chloroflexota bacterium]
MDFLLFFVLASLGGAALVAFVIVRATDRASHSAITSYFKASEFILEHHRPPPEWIMTAPGGWLRGRTIRPVNKGDVMARLDELIEFFEDCSFFEDEFAREQLLLKLREEREDWRSKLQI